MYNPVVNELKIDLQAVQEEVHFQIVNVSGQLIHEQNRVSEKSLTIDVSDYAVGTYFVNIFTSTNSLTKKLVKTR